MLFQMGLEGGRAPNSVKPGISIEYVENKIWFTSTDNPQRDTCRAFWDDEFPCDGERRMTDPRTWRRTEETRI